MSSGWHRLIRFCFVGGVVGLIDFVLIWIFLLVMPRLAAVAVAYLLAVSLHFSLNRWWVFGVADVPATGQLGRYGLTVAACWACTVGVTAFALAILTANVFVAKALAIPPATLLGFFLMRGYVFRRTNASERRPASAK
jgi:putative flippase GtrA